VSGPDVARATWRALGTTVSVVVVDPGDLDAARQVLREGVEAFDRACSRFRDDSELTALNAAAGRRVPVSPLFADALGTALRAARVTDGLVDPTVGTAMRLAGYDRDFASVADTGEPLAVTFTKVPGWQMIELDPARGFARVPPGVEVDLGATAKARCADWVANRAATVTTGGVLVNLGGDLAVGGPAPRGGWQVRVSDRHDDPDDAEGQTVAISTGGLATSGTAARRWQRGGQSLHHVVDPATGAPAPEHWRTVTVAADCCVDANIASTAAIVAGPAAPAWLAARGLPARLVRPDGEIVTVGGWPASDDLQPCSR